MDSLIMVLISSVGILLTIQKTLGVYHTFQGWEITAVNISSDSRSKMVFSVGDGLVFKMGGGESDIAQVSMADYELCSAEAPKVIYRASPTAAIYLNRTGNWFFISKVRDHCKSGKKLMITVVATHNTTTTSGNHNHKKKNRAGFRFRERSPRMGFGGHGRGGGHGNGGDSGDGGGGSIPEKGHGSLTKRRNSSTPQLSTIDFKFRLVMAAFCSVLLAGPLFV